MYNLGYCIGKCLAWALLGGCFALGFLGVKKLFNKKDK